MQQRSGCWVCWKRKLKCDSSAPKHCANCAKRGVECLYEDPSLGLATERQGRIIPSRYVTEAGIPRGRVQRACTNCAAQKLKCSGEENGCQRCSQNELVCQYPALRRGTKRSVDSRSTLHRLPQRRTGQPATNKGHSSNESQSFQEQNAEPSTEVQRDWAPSQLQSGSSQVSIVPQELSFAKGIIRQHVDAYFQYVYPITTHGFLHQGTLLEQLDSERVPAVVLKAIAVSAAQFVAPSPKAVKQIRQWAQEVDSYIMTNIGTFSTVNLQAILLLTIYYHFNRDMGKTWMLLSMAARLAYALQLHRESHSRPPEEIECQRRMMWSIRILDRLLAATVDEFSLCSKYLDKLKLPCDEHLYSAGMPAKTDTLSAFKGKSPIPNIGGFAAFVGLFDIWREILQFMRDMTTKRRQPRDFDVNEIIQHVYALRQKLIDFEQKLPSNLQFSCRNLYLHPNSSQKITFAMLQSWWYECHCDLYRFSLPGFRESLDLTSTNAAFAEHCQQQVLQASQAQSNFWRWISNTGHVFVSDPTLMVLVYSNTKTLVASTKLSGAVPARETGIPGATSDISVLLASNVSFLDELARRIPMVANIQQEIRTIVQKNDLRASSEAVMCVGLPLARRHSRQDLIDEMSQQDRQRLQGASLESTTESTGTMKPSLDVYPKLPHTGQATANLRQCPTAASDESDTGVANRIDVEDENGQSRIQIQTPVSPEENCLVSARLPGHVGGALSYETEQGLDQSHLRARSEPDSEQFLGIPDGNFMDAVPGYFSPFEIATSDDMLGAVFPFPIGSEQQQDTNRFWMQF